jgi:hypothetical protein
MKCLWLGLETMCTSWVRGGVWVSVRVSVAIVGVGVSYEVRKGVDIIVTLPTSASYTLTHPAESKSSSPRTC